MARSLYNDHSLSITEICATLGVSKATLYRYLDTPHVALVDKQGMTETKR